MTDLHTAARQALEALYQAREHVTVYTDGPWQKLEADCHAAIAALRAALEAPDRTAELISQKDGAYLERNRCVALIARMALALGRRVAVTETAIEGWSEDWHGCIYIDLPTGQVSWHFHDSQAYLFEGLPRVSEQWDGHDTPEKYRRVDAAYQGAALEAQQEPALHFIQIGDTSTPANRLASVIARGLGSDHPAMKDLVELVFAKGDHPPAQPQGWVLVPARLLQKAADVLEEATTYTGSESWSPSMTDELLALRQEMLAARPQPKETT